MLQSMDAIDFGGEICSGIGKHRELGVPGRDAIADAPSDWPRTLCPGSLNVRVRQYPAAFDSRALSHTVRELDICGFRPEFTIPQAELRNNKLQPSADAPKRGIAQVWRARLTSLATGSTVDCWLLRRIGSTVGEQLELVSNHKLRSHGLEDGDRVRVTIFGRW